MKFRSACLFVISLFLTAPATASDAQLEELTVTYFNALQSEGVGAISRFLHPEAQNELREMILPVFEFEAEQGRPGLTQVIFGGPKDIEEIRTLSPEDFVGAFMTFLGNQMQDLNVKFDKIEVLGTLPENDLRHVVTRITVGADVVSLTQMEVLTYRPYQDSWRLQLNGQFKGIAAALRNNVIQQ